jgi:hypothetical protein
MTRCMLTRLALLLAVALSAAGSPTTTASASETGMASIHSWRKVGKKTCLVDHEHSGSGSGVNRQAAELSAIRSWVGFTDLEYGSSWANINQAVGKQMRCSSGTGGIQCDLLATACRPW